MPCSLISLGLHHTGNHTADITLASGYEGAFKFCSYHNLELISIELFSVM